MKHFTFGILKQFTVASAFVLGLVSLPAYGQTFDWAAQFGGTGDDFGTSTVADNAGNSYTCGFFETEADLDPGATDFVINSPGSSDMFVVKLDISGSFVWGAHFSSPLRNRAEAITIDDNDNIYITGYFEGTVDFDPGAGTSELTSVDDRDVFVLKLDTDGNFQWVKHFGGNGFSQGLDIIHARDGHIYATGLFSGNYVYDPSGDNIAINTMGGQDGFIFEFEENGTLVDYIQTGSPNNVISYGIDIDNDGNIYTTGFFATTLDFGNGDVLTASGSRDVYIAKYNGTTGAAEWAVGGIGTGNDRARALRVGANNDVYFSGWYGSDIDFTDVDGIVTTLTNNGGNDVYVGSLTSQGEVRWIHGFGDIGTDEGYGVSLDNLDNVFVSGLFSGTVDFDPGAGTSNLTAATGFDPFILKLDSTGTFLNTITYGGERVYSLYVANDWDLYAVGYFVGTADFDPTAGTFNLTSDDLNAPYVSRFEGNCVAPDAPILTETANDICPNTTATIDITAGNLNDASDWVWYSDELFTDSIFAGTSFTTPSLTDTTTYYVRGEGACVVGTSEITINVADNTAPSVIAPDFTVATDAGVCEASGVDLGETITDNCALDQVNNDAPSVFPIGATTVTWTVTDESGNETIHAQIVTVEDQEAPVADAASLNDIIERCEVTSLMTPTATDNCDGSIAGTHDATLPITTTSTITWTYEDANGNTSTQQQEVIIQGVDVSTTVDGIELTANNSTVGVAYRWVDCNNNNAPIIDATNQVYTPEVNGSYAVIVLQDGCQDTSACIDVTTVGLEDYATSNINVYPNPSAGEFHIELASADAVNYTVTDNAGRIVLEGTFEQLENTIDLSTEEQGVYFLRVEGRVMKLVVRN